MHGTNTTETLPCNSPLALTLSSFILEREVYEILAHNSKQQLLKDNLVILMLKTMMKRTAVSVYGTLDTA